MSATLALIGSWPALNAYFEPFVVSPVDSHLASTIFAAFFAAAGEATLCGFVEGPPLEPLAGAQLDLPKRSDKGVVCVR